MRVRVLQASRNGGPGAARNRAIDTAVGQWIAIIDSDDLVCPRRLETLIKEAERDCADIVADDLFVTDIHQKERNGRLLSGRWKEAPFWVDIVDYIRLNHLYGSGPALGYLKPILRASILRDTSIRYNENLKNSEDYDLVLRLLHRGRRMRVYPFPLYIYRKHSNSLSHRLSEGALEALLLSDHRFFDQIDPDDLRVRTAVLPLG